MVVKMTPLVPLVQQTRVAVAAVRGNTVHLAEEQAALEL